MNATAAVGGRQEVRAARRRGFIARALASLLAAGVCTAARASPMCTIASGATLSFGSVVALASTGDVNTNSGNSLWLNCTSDVTAPPSLYSASTRALVSGGNMLPFALSASSPGGADLPTTAPGAQLGIARNGSNQTVTLYGRITAGNFRSLPSGIYTAVVTLTIEY